MRIPDHLRYSRNHEWMAVSGGVVRVGITDVAQDALGDVVHVKLPEVGSRVEMTGLMGEVESTKSVSEIYSPVAGVVASVNERLRAEPSLINSDPYGEGWVCELSGVEPDSLSAMMDADGYRRFVGE
jgi:glycine cleavage system H protein